MYYIWHVIVPGLAIVSVLSIAWCFLCDMLELRRGKKVAKVITSWIIGVASGYFYEPSYAERVLQLRIEFLENELQTRATIDEMMDELKSQKKVTEVLQAMDN